MTTGINTTSFLNDLALPKPLPEAKFIGVGLYYRFPSFHTGGPGIVAMTLGVFENNDLAHAVLMSPASSQGSFALEPGTHLEYDSQAWNGIGDENTEQFIASDDPKVSSSAGGDFWLRRGNVLAHVWWNGHTAAAAAFARRMDTLIQRDSPDCPKATQIRSGKIVLERSADPKVHTKILSFHTTDGTRVIPLWGTVSKAATSGMVAAAPDQKEISFATPNNLIFSVPAPPPAVVKQSSTRLWHWAHQELYFVPIDAGSQESGAAGIACGPLVAGHIPGFPMLPNTFIKKLI